MWCMHPAAGLKQAEWVSTVIQWLS
jgi:hypothetical protein